MNSLESLLLQNLDSHSVSVIGLAFLGGIVSSFLPCTIAMLPVMVGYIGGYSGKSRFDIFVQVCLFVCGLALVMTILGVTASLLGITFGGMVGSGWYIAIGVLSIVMALQLLGVFHIPLPQFIKKHPEMHSNTLLAPFILGVAFGAASSPCGTPFLAAILAFISKDRNVILGGSSLFAYALGQGILLMAAGLFTGVLKQIALMRHVGNVLNKLSAGLFLAFGGMMVALGTGQLPTILAFFHLQ